MGPPERDKPTAGDQPAQDVSPVAGGVTQDASGSLPVGAMIEAAGRHYRAELLRGLADRIEERAGLPDERDERDALVLFHVAVSLTPEECLELFRVFVNAEIQRRLPICPPSSSCVAQPILPARSSEPVPAGSSEGIE